MRISCGERLPRAQPGSDVGGKPSAVLDAQQITDQNCEPAGMGFIMRLGLRLAGRNPKRAFVGQNDLAQPSEGSSALDRRELKPFVDNAGVTQAGLRAPF